MPPVNLTLPRPHPGQAKVSAELRRFNVLACGRRWGKTLFGRDRCLRPMLAGKPVGWFAPNYRYLEDPWRDFVKLLAPITKPGGLSKQERRIEISTGGSLEFWTLDNPDAGRSRRYAHVVIDEAGMVRGLEPAWNESIRPTLADFRGSADFYGTPKGRNFFWTLFVRGQDASEKEWASWQMPTSTNPYIDPHEIAAARAGMPERSFLQEFEAAFLEEAAGVFRGVEKAIDKGRTEADAPNPAYHYSNGCDLARVEDFTVLTSIDPTGRQCFHDRFNQISWDRQIGALKAMAEAYRGTTFMDTTGIGDPIHEQATKAGVHVSPFHFTNASKQALIDHLAMGIEQGKIRLMDIPAQTAELLAYEYSLSPSRKVIMNAPAGMHDDCVIGLALAWWGSANSVPAGHAVPPRAVALVPERVNPIPTEIPTGLALPQGVAGDYRIR